MAKRDKKWSMKDHAKKKNQERVIGTDWRIFRVHKNQGPESQTVVCPTTVGLPCPICALRAKKLREGLSREEVSHLKWSEREIYNVIDKEKEEIEWLRMTRSGQ